VLRSVDRQFSGARPGPVMERRLGSHGLLAPLIERVLHFHYRRIWRFGDV